MFMDLIDFRVFLVSFSIGMFYVYIQGTDMKKIYVYPSPENFKDYIVEDNAGQCFQYKPTEVSCKGQKISEVPAQN